MARALRANNIEAIVVDTGAEARRLILELIPEGAEVLLAASKTLAEIGLFAELQESGRYDLLRTRYLTMDRATQGREIRRLIAAPDFMLGSVHAVTEDGALVTASYSASQLGPYASGAGQLILVVGSHHPRRGKPEDRARSRSGAAAHPGGRAPLRGCSPARANRGRYEDREDPHHVPRPEASPDDRIPGQGARGGLSTVDPARCVPAQEKKKLVVLRYLLERCFTDDRPYPEKEVNQQLALFHPDVASLRRYLVACGLVTRQAGIYRRA